MLLQKGASGPLVTNLQKQLNRALGSALKLPENGHFGDATRAAVISFQKMKGLVADGKVGPKTWAALDSVPASQIPVAPSQSAIVSANATFNPLGKTFDQRLDAWLADVKAKYHLTIAKVGGVRKPQMAQRWHIAHMIKYNSFAHVVDTKGNDVGRKPVHYTNVNGHDLIAWDHLSDPKLVWEYPSADPDSGKGGVRWEDFLRTKTGGVPVKAPDGQSWAAGKEPEEAATRKRAQDILINDGIATSEASRPSGAMVAPGYDGCGEPCKCGGHRSRHTVEGGLACDLTKQKMLDLETMMATSTVKGITAVNNYLKLFGLWRPMRLGPNPNANDEAWHVEPTTP